MVVNEAIDAWDRFLRTGPQPGWADDARRRRERPVQVTAAKQMADSEAIESPAAFITRASHRSFDPDRYHEVFWREWLPRAGTSGLARAAMKAEARAFEERFGDRSLADAVRCFHEGRQANACARLARLIALNQSGQNDRAAAEGLRVAAALSASGLEPGALRAELEVAYAYQRAGRRAACLQVAESVKRRAASRGYVWLADQASLEHAACADALADTGEARAEVERTLRDLDRHGLHSAALRARSFVSGLDSVTGNYAPIWSNAANGLRAYWNSAASDYRAQEFEYYLYISAKMLGWKKSALVLLRAAIASLGRVGNHEMEAADRAELAMLLGDMGDRNAQRVELANAAAAAAMLPEGPSKDDLEWNLELRRIEADLDAGRSGLEPEIGVLAQRATGRRSGEQIRLLQVKGRAAFARGDWVSALSALKAAVRANERRISSVKSFVERTAERELAAPSYRLLTQLELLQEHDPAGALAVWRNYLDEAGSGLDTIPEVTMAALPAGIVVWGQKGALLRVRWLNQKAPTVQGMGCASRSFAPTLVRANPKFGRSGATCSPLFWGLSGAGSPGPT